MYIHRQADQGRQGDGKGTARGGKGTARGHASTRQGPGSAGASFPLLGFTAGKKQVKAGGITLLLLL